MASIFLPYFTLILNRNAIFGSGRYQAIYEIKTRYYVTIEINRLKYKRWYTIDK